MVWQITYIDKPKDQNVVLFSNNNNGQAIANPGAVLGGGFILAFPGLGYIRLIDRGNAGTYYVLVYSPSDLSQLAPIGIIFMRLT